MTDPQATLKRAETTLNAALREYESPSTSLALEFRELKLQSCIFQYDICAEMAALARNQPTGFASSVAVKGLVLRLFEYDLLLSKHLIPRLLALAKARQVPFDSESIKVERRTWKAELNRLRSWASVRNQAAGHYGHDLKSQVLLLKSLEVAEVMAVTRAFLSFNRGLIRALRDAGRKNDA